MAFRKQRNPTPGFRIPVPYNPITGEHAPLRKPEDKHLARLVTTLEAYDEVEESGGSCQAEIWNGYPPEATGKEIEAYDWLLGTGESLAAGTKVVIEKIADKWYVTNASCTG